MGHWNDKYVIGITGNIATGKSLVRKMLQHLGAYTIDADGLAHQIMAPNAPAYRPTIEWFGRWIVDGEGRIDREKLGAVAFSHDEALKRLESITHPIIGRAIDTLVGRSKKQLVAIEAIKLLEGDLASKVDAIWVIDSTIEKQLERLMKTRGLSEEEARKRIAVQNPQADKIKAAHLVIQNNGDPNATFEQVKAGLASRGSADDTGNTERIVTIDPAQTRSSDGQKQVRELKEIKIRRPKPSHFGAIANLLNVSKGTSLTADDIMQGFSETSYLAAESNDEIVGVIGFVVENLITQSSDVAFLPDVPIEPVLVALIKEMEQAADDLQSEVSFIYLNRGKSAEIISLLQNQLEYELKEKVEDIKVPAWREAVRSSQPEGTVILFKKLREERILTPF